MSKPKSPKPDSIGGAGYSGPILSRNQSILDSLIDPDSPGVAYDPKWAWGPSGVNQSSENHEAGAWTGEAVRSALSVNSNHDDIQAQKHQTAAFDVLLSKYFPRELGPRTHPSAIGLWGREQLCPDNHTHQHLQGTGMARVAAVVSKEPSLLERSGLLLRATSFALQALATPAPYFFVCAPGFRQIIERDGSTARPSFFYGTAFLRQLLRSHIGDDTPIMPRWKDSSYRDLPSVGIRAIHYLQSIYPSSLATIASPLAGADIVKQEGCRLKYEVLVYRGQGYHLAVMPKPKPSSNSKLPTSGVCDWVKVPWGIKTYKGTMEAVTYGLNWTTPPPSPPKGAEVIRFPAMFD